MIKFSRNHYQTPNKDLTIDFSENNLILKARLKKSKTLMCLYLFFFLVFFLLGLGIYFFFSQNQFSFPDLMLFVLMVIIGYSINIFILRIIFVKNKDSRMFLIERTMFLMNELIISLVILIPIINHFFTGFNFQFIMFFFVLSAIWNYLGYYIYHKKWVEITVSRKDGKFDIIAFENYPLVNFSIKFLVQRHVLFSASLTELYLSLVPFARSSRITKLRFNNRILFNYSWMSLEEAKNYAQEKNEFICFFVDNRIEFSRNFGAIIGTNFSIESIINVLTFINNFAPISVVKLENKTENDFVNYSIANPNKPNKSHKTVSWIIGSIILIPSYILLIPLTLLVLYVVITNPQLNFKMLFSMLLIPGLIAWYLPFYIWRSSKKAKERENNIINQFD